MEITVNDVLNGVTQALAEHFPDIPRYGEEIEQGVEPPFFFVKLFPATQTRELGRRYYRIHAFDIHYFPDPAQEINEAANDMAEKLYGMLEYLPVGSELCRGSQMRHEIAEGVMHFFVNYNFHVRRSIPETTKMQKFDQEVGIG